MKGEKVEKDILVKADSMVAAKKVGSQNTEARESHSVFYFDPNTITDSQWHQLGLGQRTISTIRNFLSKGGRFRDPADLERIYGMQNEDADRLLPYVRIRSNSRKYISERINPAPVYHSRPVFPNFYPKKNYEKRSITVDLNASDSVEFEALPGIGVKLASRIVRFRESLGGFHSVEQLKDVYGINDTLFNLIKTSIKIEGGVYRKIRINHWGADSLDLHPYILKHEARAIVKYREQHGRFGAAEDLLALGMINAEWILRLRPYFDFE